MIISYLSFVPSKIFRRASVQTLKSDSRFARHTGSIASQAAPPDCRSAAPDPASPRIAAKLATPSSLKSSSTQEASAKPTSTQAEALDTAAAAGASKLNVSTAPGSDSQSAADAQGLLINCAREPCLIDGKEQKYKHEHADRMYHKPSPVVHMQLLSEQKNRPPA